MSRWTSADVQAAIRRGTPAPRRSKYGNVKVRVDGHVFDSKHEAQHYAELKLRQRAGEILDLRVHVPFNLVTVGPDDRQVVVATYVADFTYVEAGSLVVADTKGKLTDVYKLKRKWLRLQEGIEIREVYRR